MKVRLPCHALFFACRLDYCSNAKAGQNLKLGAQRRVSLLVNLERSRRKEV